MNAHPLNRHRVTGSPFILASLALHGVALALALIEPDRAALALALVLLDQGLIILFGLLPRSTQLGANRVRLPPAAVAAAQVSLTFDDGPDPAVTPQLLALLDQHRIKATFFCIGERAQAHPDLCREIVTRGHQVENHGQRHRPWLALSGPGGWRSEVQEGQRTLTRLTGRAPRFYRPLAGIRNPFLDPALQCLGLPLTSWTRRAYDTRCGDPERILARLTQGLQAGDILLLHDGHGALTPQGTPVVLAVLPRLLAELNARGLRPVPLARALGMESLSELQSSLPDPEPVR